MKTLKIELPEALAAELEELMETGWFTSEEESVRQALADYLLRRPFELQERFLRGDIAWALGQPSGEETSTDPSGERDRFVEAVEEGLADAEAGRVISDEELGARLDEELGPLGTSGLKKRLRKDRPMATVSVRMPEDVVHDLEQLAPRLGFSGYQPLLRAYVGQGLRRDLEAAEGADHPTEWNPRPVRRRQPTHPGEILRDDVLPALQLSVTQAAGQLRVTRQTLQRVLAGRAAVTAEMALRLGRFCGNGPDLWLRMQQAHDLWRARERLGEELETIPEHHGTLAREERATDSD